MPLHVIVDGSNLATEGRTQPSLSQLNEAIAAYRGDHPEALITVVVDATFGHRIDPSESAEFERAIETNAFVAPPAGAVGRGDGFILSIAQKVNAVILSNDSYQEFHGEYAWLFDRGRLIGGKPVPHVGWVFVERVPVRGPVSRRSVKEQKIVDKSPTRVRSRSRSGTAAAISADAPMPVPTSPPPGAVLRQPRQRVAATAAPAPEEIEAAPIAHAKAMNDLMPFLTFVEHHPVGSAIEAVVDHYSSHGAYVLVGDVIAYVPLRLMADPAPRSAREVMAVGATVSLVVHSFTPGRRSIDLATPAMAPTVAEVVAKPKRAAAKRVAKAVAPAEHVEPAAAAPESTAPEFIPPESAAAPAAGRRRGAKQAPSRAKSATPPPAPPEVQADVVSAPTTPGRSRKRAAAADAPSAPSASTPSTTPSTKRSAKPVAAAPARKPAAKRAHTPASASPPPAQIEPPAKAVRRPRKAAASQALPSA